MTQKRLAFIAVMFLAAIASMLPAVTNYLRPGDVVTLTWSGTSPTMNDAVIKCSTKATGGIVGVALNGTATANENVSVATKGIFDLPVTASSTVGNIAVGDYIYAAVTTATQSTATLSNINTGLLYGVALEAVTASTTAGVYSTIEVLLRQPGHL